MSWITFIWSAVAGACLTLGAVHLLVWLIARNSWSNLLFAIAAVAGAATATIELVLMRTQTPAQYVAWMAYMHVTVSILVVSLVWFVRVHLSAGRLWLAWLVLGFRVVVVLLAFGFYPASNFSNFSSLHPVSFLGETVVAATGDRAPFVYIGHLSGILFLVFALDASVSAWRRGDRRRASTVTVTFGLAIVAGLTMGALLNHGTLAVPYTVSFPFLIIIAGIAYELSLDVLRASQLARMVRDNEVRMRLATEAANLGVWEWDIVRDEIWFTETIRVLFKLGAAERPNLARILHAIYPDDRTEVEAAVRECLEHGRDFQMEYRLNHSAEDIRWIVAHGQVEQDPHGRPILMRGVAVDITARKQAEKTIQLQRSELAHISRVSTIGQLASALAHELLQPLGAILRNAEAAELFLNQDPPDLAEVRAILTDICHDDQRASAVIDRMRSLLKQRDLEFESLSLTQAIHQVVTLLHPEMIARRVTIQLDLPIDLPPVRGDRVHLQQVILNLLVNGADAMNNVPVDRRQLCVWAGTIDPQTVKVAVSDCGHGIPEEKIARVFDPFFTTKTSGMGMGLAISKTIIEAHGGRIWAENKPEGGATFRFTLKRAV